MLFGKHGSSGKAGAGRAHESDAERRAPSKRKAKKAVRFQIWLNIKAKWYEHFLGLAGFDVFTLL